ncbi:MAG: gamma-glutamyltransferase, partial [Comamonadaceae bacterium]
ATADRGGMMVSLIQSNFHGFGSGVVVPGTGASLNNRGSGFSLQAGHPNLVAGGKKPFHTIIPAMLTRGGKPLAALGVVGANMQPQGQVQVISAIEDLGLNPQSALDMPRWRIDDVGTLRLESGFDPRVAEALRARGHPVDVRAPHDPEFGGAQLAMCGESGYIAASDPRRDGTAAGF